jgi:hypothetical protein
LLLVRPAWSVPLSAVGLIGFTLLDTVLATDWVLSLDPHFHSSGFGLYLMSVQVLVALAAIVVLRLMRDRDRAQRSKTGALLLTGLLVWAYLSFMPYFISWSENLPEPAAWYQIRGSGLWAIAEYAIGALHLIPLLLLFFTPVRQSRSCLLALALAVLTGSLIEVAWLIFPETEIGPLAGATAVGLALVSVGSLSIAFLAAIRRADLPRRRSAA